MKTIELENIGKVSITRRRNAKRMNIRIKTSGEILMSIPYLTSFQEAERFLKKQEVWINSSKAKLSRMYGGALLQCNHSYPFADGIFSIIPHNKLEIAVSRKQEHVFVHVPFSQDFSDLTFQKHVKKIFIEVLRTTAKNFLPGRIGKLAAECGFSYSEVRIKNQQTRWGSCSISGNINLNLHLMRLPKHLIDYVLIHELCHTKQANHSSKFYDLLQTILPNYKLLEKELRNYSVNRFESKPLSI